METEISIDKYTLVTLECILRATRGRSYEEVFDASVYLYCFVLREKIYPQHIVDGFYGAMAIIAKLTFAQFLQLKSQMV